MAKDRRRPSPTNGLHSVAATASATNGRSPDPDVRPKATAASWEGTGARPKTTGAVQNPSGASQRAPRLNTPQSNQAEQDVLGLLHTLTSEPLTAEENRPLERQLSTSRPKRLLEGINLPQNITQSSTFCAVEIHLRDDLPEFAVEENQLLLKTAIRAFLARTGQYPKAAELLEDIIDADFQEDNVLKNFAKWSLKQFGGVENVPVFHNTDGRVGAGLRADIEHQEREDKHNPDGNDSICQIHDSVSTETSRWGNTNQGSPGIDLNSDLRLPDVETFQTSDSRETEKQNSHENGTIASDTRPTLRERLEKVLRREREYLRRRVMCSRCGERPTEVTFLPCSHLVTCSTCANECKSCPLCGAKVLAEAKTFLV